MIRELSSWENMLFRMGAILMLIGVTVHIFNAEISLFIYGIGAMLFCLMQLRAVYEGNDLNVIRLRRQQLFACLMFIGTAMCMSMQVYQYGFARRNEWVVALAIGCVLELYTAWRIPNALQKAKKS
ncbi:MAG: hypothetical protein J6P55_06390 [Bacteroidaceae bacterium]|nr:hypothetical protein [Bacteroidaceae bacterium]MBR1902993.1 hypothetical protein [Bacteroidaceae bacterium]